MKQKILLLVFSFAFCFLTQAQLFNNDVKISTNNSENRKDVQIEAAFNGWLYAAYSTDDVGGIGKYFLQKSTDNGLTWTAIDSSVAQGRRFTKIDLVVAGNDTANLAVFVAIIIHATSNNSYTINVDKYDGSGTFLGKLFKHTLGGTLPINGVAMATDSRFPAIGVSPYSIGLAYTCSGATKDSVILLVSTDGGSTFRPRVPVRVSNDVCGDVSITYGRSPSSATGRYFLAWNETTSSSPIFGNIFTAHNQTSVFSATTNAIDLTSGDATAGSCRNPKIAAQQNSLDNDSAGVTVVITTDGDFGGAGVNRLLALYSKHSIFGDFWNMALITSNASGIFATQADICYDPAANNFLLTYLDSTNLQLLYRTQNFNMPSPNSWTTVSTNYANTNQILGKAFPKVVVNPVTSKAAFAWIKQENSKGVAFFDAEYTIVSISDLTNEKLAVKVYPNPVANILRFDLGSNNTALVKIYNLKGKLIKTEQVNNNQTLDVTELASGVYSLEISSNGKFTSTKIIKQ